jgi:hypothetical protein
MHGFSLHLLTEWSIGAALFLIDSAIPTTDVLTLPEFSEPPYALLHLETE